jgi:hypothetical protein
LANLTSRLGFGNDFIDFAQAQNQDIQSYLLAGLGLDLITDAPIVVTLPDFRGAHLDRRPLMAIEIWRDVS